jgi:Dockerin type I domain
MELLKQKERVIRSPVSGKLPPNFAETADRMVSTPAHIRVCDPPFGGVCTAPVCSTRDDNNDTYMPDATNFMSYFFCPTSIFTPEQQTRMNNSLMSTNERSNIVNGSCAENIANIGWITRPIVDECTNGNDIRIKSNNVNVAIQNSANGSIICASPVKTDVTGYYQSCSFPKNSSITITPTKNTNYREGVTTFDVAMISNHITGYAPFTNPFQMLAADANNDGEIDAIDMLAIRRLILRFTETFPNNVGS